jgi:hypothetical protein
MEPPGGHDVRPGPRAASQHGRLGARLSLRPAHIDMMAATISVRYCVSIGAVWCNLYCDGNDSVAWHGDRVLRDPSDGLVLIVSMGRRRRFLIKPAGGASPRANRALTWTRPHPGGRVRAGVVAHSATGGGMRGCAAVTAHDEVAGDTGAVPLACAGSIGVVESELTLVEESRRRVAQPSRLPGSVRSPRKLGHSPGQCVRPQRPPWASPMRLARVR